MFYKRQISLFIRQMLRDEKIFVCPAKITFVTNLGSSVPCQIKLFDLTKTDKIVICFISLNKKYFTLESDRNILKAYLLHELGHCFCTDARKNPELCAQLWAIKKSKKMGFSRLTAILENLIIEWKTMEWKNKRLRIYIRAGREYARRAHKI